jgi:subtilisin family serine protease
MTVAAGTHDRFYAASVTRGDGVVHQGASLGTGTPMLPVILAIDAGLPGFPIDQVQQCWSNNTGGGLLPPTGPEGPRLDPAKVAGKIVVCDRGGSARTDKSVAVRNAGGLGMILTNVTANTVDADLHAVPTVHLQNTERAAIYGYVSGTANPTAQLSAGVITAGVVAPDVAAFSSRGPALAAGGDMLKPDIMAPGVAILAAVSPANVSAPGRNFDFYQGTSMSSPHIAGIGALMKQRHPDWSPMMIKSALMTTASQLRNNGTPIAGGRLPSVRARSIQQGRRSGPGLRRGLQ